MEINGSVNISDFNFSACINLSTAIPSTDLTDLSTYIAAGFEGIIFNLTSPSGLLFYEGDFSSGGDITTEGGSVSIPNLPTLGNNIEFGTYKIEAFIKDQDGNIFKWADAAGLDYKTIEVCKPNTLAGATGFYGGMSLVVETDCQNNRICFTDNTSKVYKGVTGSLPYTTELKIIYPPDPETFVQGATQTTTLLPACYTITQNGRYQFKVSRVVTYDLGNDTCIIIKYQYINEDYRVQCNVDLCPLMCDYVRLVQKFDDARCAGDTAVIEDLQPKLTIINSKFIEFEENRRCGVDVTDIVEEIAEIGGFDCQKCFPSTIIPNPVIINNGVFSVTVPCGDITAEVTQEGNNVNIELQDKSYFLQFDAASQAYLSVERNESDCNVNFVITLDLSTITDNLCKVRVSEDDECCEYLIDKLQSNSGAVSFSEVDEDASPITGCKKINVELVEPEWENIAFEAGFANFGGATQPAQIRKWANGKVEVRGRVAASNYPTLLVVSNLDSAYDPSDTQHFSVNLNNSGTYVPGEFQLTTAGQLTLLANTIGGVSATFPMNFEYYTT